MIAPAKVLPRFAIFAWVVLAFNVLVILWGAFVRANGAGAGCGSHWPLCNGQILPQSPQIETLIEFTHRVMSGLSLALIAVLLIWAWRAFPKGHRVRAGAVACAILIVTEALIGAGLVLFGWVAKDVSVARTISISLHLVNTFLLLGALTLTAWWASGGAAVHGRGPAGPRAALALGLIGVALIGITGAITALGDTLFPAGSLAAGLAQDISPTASFLIRLRIFHPLIAVIVGTYILLVLSYGGDRLFSPAAIRLGWVVRGLVLLQLAAGAANVFLLAPVWMQLTHLFLADLVWISLILYSASTLGEESVPGEGRLVAAGQPVD